MGKGRKACCDKEGVKKGAWCEDEDMKLISFIQTHGHSNWRALPKLAGLARCGKSCRLRWVNYLRPDIKRGNFTPQEEDAIIKLHQTLGNRWSKIASHFPGRTDNEIKNVWNTHLKKRVKTKEISITISDMTSNEQQQQQQLNSPSSSYCSQASFSDFQMNDFNPDMVIQDVCDMDEVGINVKELKTDLVINELFISSPVFEPNFEWRDLLDGDFNCEVKLNEDDSLNNPISGYEKINSSSEESDGSWWWLVYLENELGLVSHS